MHTRYRCYIYCTEYDKMIQKIIWHLTWLYVWHILVQHQRGVALKDFFTRRKTFSFTATCNKITDAWYQWLLYILEFLRDLTIYIYEDHVYIEGGNAGAVVVGWWSTMSCSGTGNSYNNSKRNTIISKLIADSYWLHFSNVERARSIHFEALHSRAHRLRNSST